MIEHALLTRTGSDFLFSEVRRLRILNESKDWRLQLTGYTYQDSLIDAFYGQLETNDKDSILDNGFTFHVPFDFIGNDDSFVFFKNTYFFEG